MLITLEAIKARAEALLQKVRDGIAHEEQELVDLVHEAEAAIAQYIDPAPKAEPEPAPAGPETPATPAT